MQGAPKYETIELYWLDDTKTDFKDCGMILTADKIIVISDKLDSISGLQKTEGQVFELSKMKKYITYKSK